MLYAICSGSHILLNFYVILVNLEPRAILFYACLAIFKVSGVIIFKRNNNLAFLVNIAPSASAILNCRNTFMKPSKIIILTANHSCPGFVNKTMS